MEDEIVNRVANSVLIVFDLEDYYPDGVRTQLDISIWLTEGLLLREKEFREQLRNHDWSQYRGQFVAIYCSTDAIVPAWAYILVTTHLAPYASEVVNGTIDTLEHMLYQQILSTIDFSMYTDKPVIIKGCSRKPVPVSAYVMAAKQLQPFAKSIMYGEACSAVPLYKRK